LEILFKKPKTEEKVAYKTLTLMRTQMSNKIAFRIGNMIDLKFTTLIKVNELERTILVSFNIP
jgi:hypothetical protein